MKKRGKNYRAKAPAVDAAKRYKVDEAFSLIDKVKYAKFDESVDLAVRLGVDPKHSDQMVRGSVPLPHGTGKSVRIIVFARGDKMIEAQTAGADHVGGDDLVAKIQGGFMDFDVAVATPDMMATVSKIGKVLGPKGLMPNPKSGTVTMDVSKAIKELKAGRVEFRTEKAGIVHARLGRVSFGEQKLKENFQAVMEAIQRLKPSSAKGKYLRSMAISTTMSPSLRLDVGQFEQAV